VCGAVFKFNIPMSELLPAKIDPLIEQKKATAWSTFGVQLYRKEIQLQLLSQQIIAKLVTPQTPEQIQQAEQALATVKKDRDALIEQRKEKTEHFRNVTNRLMQPEKNIDTEIVKVEAALLKVKQQEKNKEKEKSDKEKELKAIAEQTRVYVADMHASILKALAKLINDAYKHALEIEKPVTDIPAFIEKVTARVNASTTTTPKPKPAFKFNTQEDVDAEIEKNFSPWQTQQYIDGFKIDIEKKFFDWGNALKNKPLATELNDTEFTETVAAIDENKERETISAKLDNIAEAVTETAVGKPLKEEFTLDEPETIEQAIVIINAFTVNRALCIPEMRKIKPANIGVKQMISALEAVKNNDNNFAVTGLVFKKVDKL
jgi:small-conductance mechanosensitive channel